MNMGIAMGNVVDLSEVMCRQQAAVRASLNARAASLGISDTIRRRWVWKAITMLDQGSSLEWAISESIRGITSEHLAAKG